MLTYSLFGRFIHAAGYTNKYPEYDDFEDEIWQKSYIKFPVYIGLTLGLCFMCLIRDINKLNFSLYWSRSRNLFSHCCPCSMS